MDNALIIVKYIIEKYFFLMFNDFHLSFAGSRFSLGSLILVCLIFSTLFAAFLNVIPGSSLPKVNSHRDTGSKELATIERRD